jgi:hypothetical protein
LYGAVRVEEYVDSGIEYRDIAVPLPELNLPLRLGGVPPQFLRWDLQWPEISVLGEKTECCLGNNLGSGGSGIVQGLALAA